MAPRLHILTGSIDVEKSDEIIDTHSSQLPTVPFTQSTVRQLSFEFLQIFDPGIDGVLDDKSPDIDLFGLSDSMTSVNCLILCTSSASARIA